MLIIKKRDGTKIDPSQSLNNSISDGTNYNVIVNPGVHEPVTHKATSTFYSKKAKENVLVVEDGIGQILYMRILSDSLKTLSVTKHMGKTLSVTKHKGYGKSDHNEEKYVIPEYVDFQNEIYTVISIDDEAFSYVYIKEVIFPATLKSIGKRAFCACTFISKIVLPESVESIGDYAFYAVGLRSAFEQLYIPKGVKTIGKGAFHKVGNNRSPRGYFQGHLTSMPNFISVGNCKNYGIDEVAVETYEKRYMQKGTK